MSPPGPDDRREHRLLVADAGGTFLRLALAQDGQLLTAPVTLARDDFADLGEACLSYLHSNERQTRLDGAVLAAAGSRRGQRLEMTIAAWSIDADELANGLGIPAHRLRLLNDFEALAWALPSLQAHEQADLPGGGQALAGLGPPAGEPLANRLLLGPGTGLGVAGLIRVGAHWQPLASEGGHMSFSPQTPFEQAIDALARRRFGRVSWERVLSGPGLGLIHHAARLDAGQSDPGRTAAWEDPAAVLAACRQGDPVARQAVQVFLELLGAFAGDLALGFDARGGVMLTGGVFERLAGLVSLDPVRVRFEDKGRFRHWLAAVPLRRLQSPHAALKGAALAYLA